MLECSMLLLKRDVLDQLAANGTDVKGHHRKLKKKQYAAVHEIEY